jgi:cytoskeleton protein RodZ
MGYIGEQLSTARRALGLSAADAAAALRIRAMFVDALEREDWSTIGEFVYVRGFLKNYARLLGLDPAPLTEQLAQDYRPEAFAPRPSAEGFANSGLASARSESALNARFIPWVLGSLTAVATVLVIMVVVSLLGLFSHPSSSVTQPAVAPPQTTPVTIPAPSGSGSDVLETGGDAQAPNGGVNLRLQLTQSSWLSVTVDGKRVVYETLPAGTIRDFHGAREITLRAGNAGGVVANIDGKDLGALGQAGQVEDRRFAANKPVDQLKALHE